MKKLPYLLCVLPLLFALCHAQTVHPKNQSTHSAPQARETDHQVVYLGGGGTHTGPLSSSKAKKANDRGCGFGLRVGTSKSGWIAPSRGSGHSRLLGETFRQSSHRELGTAMARQQVTGNSEQTALAARVIDSSGVDERALYDIEAEGDVQKTAAAYLIASRYAYLHSDGEAARRYMRHCLSLAPPQPAMLEWDAFLLVDGGDYDAAVTEAEKARKQAPESATALQLLGMAYYDSGRFDDAINTWKQAQQIKPSKFVTAYIAKATREQRVEGKFDEQESEHFVLRYKGSQTGFGFANELMYTLDQQYAQLQDELGFSPGITITVIAYTQRQFREATAVPDWAGGLNDGKIRIPVRNLNSVTPRLKEVLRHEMAHSFIHAYTHGNCPTWLNEGIAQMVEPRSTRAYASRLARLFRQHREAPLHDLEGPFLGLNTRQAGLAYAESLAAVEYLRSADGVYGLRKILDALSQGDRPEAALEQGVHLSYKQLESNTAAYLADHAD